MVIFDAGVRLWPITSFGSMIRVYSRTAPSQLFSKDGRIASFELTVRITAYQNAVKPFGPDLPVLNQIIADLPEGHELKSVVFSRDTLNYMGHRLEDMGQEADLLNKIEKMIVANFGWRTFMDFIDRQPVLIVVGDVPAMAGR